MLGTPGDCFAAVANNGNFVVFQGSPDKPGELICNSLGGAARWAKVATSAGRDPHLLWALLVLAQGRQCDEYPSYATALYATTKSIGQGRGLLRRDAVQRLHARLSHHRTCTTCGPTTAATMCSTPSPNSHLTGELHPGVSAQWAGSTWAFHGQFVCAENGGGDVINAKRTTASDWETFTFVDVPGTLGTIHPPDDPAAPRSSRTVALRTYSGHYVSAPERRGSTLSAEALDPRSGRPSSCKSAAMDRSPCAPATAST